MKVEVIENKGTFILEVFIGGVNFGVFEDIDKGAYCYFPKYQDRLTGDHYIAIGKALNEINRKKLRNSQNATKASQTGCK